MTRTIMRLGAWQDSLQLVHAHDWHKPDEKQKEGEENAKGPGRCQDVNDCGMKVLPRGGKKAVGECRGDDHETLEPHSDITKECENEDQRQASSNCLEPEELGHRQVD